MEFGSEIVQNSRYEKITLHSLEHLQLANDAFGRTNKPEMVTSPTGGAITLTKFVSQSIQFLPDITRDALIGQENPIEEEIEIPKF
jgi:hypothetical protein